MPTHSHFCVVWIDHLEARVFHFDPGDAELAVVRPDNPVRHVHHKANSIGSGHAATDQAYLHAVTEALANASSVLLTGPAGTKTDLVKHIHRHDPALMERIAGIETVDHPSDKSLVAFAKSYFGVSAPRVDGPRRRSSAPGAPV